MNACLIVTCHTEAAPAAGSQWPSRLFTALRLMGCFLSALPSTATAAPSSIGSPKGVPVPCISRLSTASGCESAFSRACLMTYRRSVYLKCSLYYLKIYLKCSCTIWIASSVHESGCRHSALESIDPLISLTCRFRNKAAFCIVLPRPSQRIGQNPHAYIAGHCC